MMSACLLYDKIHIEMVKTASKNYKWILLALICATYFLAQGTRQIFNTVLPQIKADFAGVGIDDAQLGLVGSAFMLVFGLTIPLCAVKAWSTPESMLMKWCAGRPKSMTFAAEMQMSAFAARRFSRSDRL
jgi:hypothetical protein